MNARRGFTLIELLVVLAMVGLITALVPFAFGRLRESVQYRDTVRALLSDMRQARQIALLEGREMRLAVDLSRRSFGLEGRAMHVVPEPLQLRAVTANLEAVPGRTASIRFLPGGGATGGTLEVLRPSGAGTRLTVDWLSGSASQTPVQQ